MKTLSGVLLLALMSGACVAATEQRGGEGRRPQCGSDIDEEIRAGPTFTPFHVRPELIDEARFRRQLEVRISEAAAAHRSDPHPVGVWILVASQGCTARVVLEGSSGSPEVDSVIRDQWAQAEWTRPILRLGTGEREEAVPAWIKEGIGAGGRR